MEYPPPHIDPITFRMTWEWGQVLQSYIGVFGLLQAATDRGIVEAHKGYVGLQDLRSFMASPVVAARSERNRRLWYDSEP